MILYIHGFGSSGKGGKSSLLREYFKSIDEPFIAPSLSYIPDLAIQTLEELIESYQNVRLIGSSLGGYYSLYLSQKYGLKTVLINPSIYPYITLDLYRGNAPSYYDESSFKWTSSHIQALKTYQSKDISETNLMLLLQKGDETLNYKEALKFLPHAKAIVEEEGNHSFVGIERYFEEIKGFLDA